MIDTLTTTTSLKTTSTFTDGSWMTDNATYPIKSLGHNRFLIDDNVIYFVLYGDESRKIDKVSLSNKLEKHLPEDIRVFIIDNSIIHNIDSKLRMSGKTFEEVVTSFKNGEKK